MSERAVTYVLDRAVSQQECPWLDSEIPSGSIVYRYDGYTYGCIGPDGIAVTHSPGVEPFFEVPRAALSLANPEGNDG